MSMELKSIEPLIVELLQQQSDLCSRLAHLEPQVDQPPWTPISSTTPPDVPGPSSPQSPTWALIVKGTKRLSLPVYDPPDADIPLSNFFSLLAEPDTPDSAPRHLAHRTVLAQPALRKHHAPFTSTSSSGSPSPMAPSGKRPCLSPADSETSVSAPASSASSRKTGAQSSIPPDRDQLTSPEFSSMITLVQSNLRF